MKNKTWKNNNEHTSWGSVALLPAICWRHFSVRCNFLLLICENKRRKWIKLCKTCCGFYFNSTYFITNNFFSSFYNSQILLLHYNFTLLKDFDGLKETYGRFKKAKYKNKNLFSWFICMWSIYVFWWFWKRKKFNANIFSV